MLIYLYKEQDPDFPHVQSLLLKFSKSTHLFLARSFYCEVFLLSPFMFTTKWANQMPQWVKMLSPEADSMSLSPRTHMLEKEKWHL